MPKYLLVLLLPILIDKTHVKNNINTSISFVNPKVSFTSHNIHRFSNIHNICITTVKKRQRDNKYMFVKKIETPNETNIR